MKKLNLLVLLALAMSSVSLVSVTIADVTDHWGTVDQSGETLRVPWKTSTVIGLWTTCTYRESGFVREEVYSYNCYPTKDGEHVSAGDLGVSQGFVIVSTAFTALTVVTGGLYLLVVPNKSVVLVVATILGILSVISASVSLATFQSSLKTVFTPSWSFYVGAASLGCKVLAVVTYVAALLKTCCKTNSVTNDQTAQPDLSKCEQKTVIGD
ncbi:uncharacterized protein [Argopecten irradians]|uniref:uncharacterized protein n=1 Tax=Argopecten irradians TaxID=31199 RepID=UPI003714D832